MVTLFFLQVTYISGCTGLLSAGNNTVYCPSETGKGLLQKRGMDGSLPLDIFVLVFFYSDVSNYRPYRHNTSGKTGMSD
ncbi:hypothetical protein KIN20_000245 [Parelaphostrongylus tenuis]|uniref:Secreted protein n=1 Tax=Parelaphostrongylus tenuis TaxID=148309 RepID=A0AAD5QFW0_PARTN|nr:hypothetical protein KIN20_000245 [Parelaphostrongylus tenuis]